MTTIRELSAPHLPFNRYFTTPTDHSLLSITSTKPLSECIDAEDAEIWISRHGAGKSGLEHALEQSQLPGFHAPVDNDDGVPFLDEDHFRKYELRRISPVGFISVCRLCDAQIVLLQIRKNGEEVDYTQFPHKGSARPPFIATYSNPFDFNY